MPDDNPRPLTVLLRAWQGGERAALDQLMPIVYEEIHRMAAAHMRRERSGHTWSPTDLVSEAFLRLAGESGHSFQDRVHFFAIAARHMRQILVSHAREKSAAKRGGRERGVTFDEELVAGGRPSELVDLDEALAELAKADERKARIIELCYFGGMDQKEIAVALGVHLTTVERDLRFAKAWILRYLREGA